MMTYQEAIQYLNSFIDYEKNATYPYKSTLDLRRIRNFLTTVGNPQKNLKFIHIAGTKAKGSTCSYVAHILRSAGYNVGLYTSPHLSDFRERIRVLRPIGQLSTRQLAKNEFEGMISKEEVLNLVNKLEYKIREFYKKSKYGDLTFFEIYTALAFLYFLQTRVDFVVLETGLGGRLDATNTVRPIVCGITPISYEHTAFLGDTLAKIAKEKVGIIKSQGANGPGSQGLIVVSAPQEEEVRAVIRKRCMQKKARLSELGKDILFERVGTNNKGEIFNISSRLNNYNNLEIPFFGFHQIINATLAVGIVEALGNFGFIISSNKVRKGLLNSRWPARFEIVSKKPLVILDGAQNVASAIVLRNTLKERFPKRKTILVFGVSSDKDIKGICNELFPICKKIILTRADNPRATKPTSILESVEALRSNFPAKFFVSSNVKEAMRLAKKSWDCDSLILVAGSLYVAGEARKICLN